MLTTWPAVHYIDKKTAKINKKLQSQYYLGFFFFPFMYNLYIILLMQFYFSTGLALDRSLS